MQKVALALAILASFSIHAEESNQPEILEVSLNQNATHQVITFWPGDGGSLVASVEDWKALGIVLKPDEESLPKLSTAQLEAKFTVNEDAQSISLILPPDRLPAQKLKTGQREKLPLAEPAKALLINYNISATKSYPGNYMGASLGHDLHLPMFGGVLSTSGQLNYNTTDGTEYRRLYTTWEKDNYSKLESIQVGDVFAYGPGASSMTTNLAGIRWAKDPAGLDPTTPTYPLPTINGLVASPGMLEVLANQSPLVRANVQSGPFQVDQLQAQAGLNLLQAVVNDGYGRQTVINAGSYYVAPTLLRQGLDTWDFSAGLIRREFSDTYRGVGLNARYSKGWTDSTTWTAQAQASNDGENLSGTLTQKIWNAGVITTSFALSDGRTTKGRGLGWYGSVGYDYRQANWGIHFQRYQQSDNFWQLHDPSMMAYQPLSSTIIGGSWSSENKRFTAQLNYNDLRTSYSTYKQVLGNLSWSAHGHHLNLSAGYDLSHHSPSVMVSYGYSFSKGSVTASVGENNGGKQEQLTGSYNYNSEAVQAQLGATLSKTDLYQLALLNGSINTNVGSGRFMLESFGNQGTVNGSWTGSLVASTKGFGFTQYSPTGYVLIDVPGVSKVPVTLSGRTVATTNSNGMAVIGQVPSLVAIPVGIKESDIPIGVDIDSPQQQVVVPKLGGAVIHFNVATMDGRTFHVQHGGKDVAEGATVESGEVIGFDGQLYFEHPPLGKTLSIKLPDGSSCKAVFPSTLPTIGGATDIECK